MHIVRQTPQELIVADSSRWVSAICAAAAIFILYFVITRHELKGLFVAGFFLLFAVIMDLRKTFTFDAMQRIVRWNGRKVFKAESGEIPFDDISDIGTQTTVAGENSVPTYRLTIITSRATIPMAYTTAGTTTITPLCASRFLASLSPDRQGSLTKKPRSENPDLGHPYILGFRTSLLAAICSSTLFWVRRFAVGLPR